MRVVAHVGQEMFHRAEQKRTEPAPLRFDTIDTLPGQQTREEFLGQIAGRIFTG